MPTFTIIGGVNGTGKSSLSGVLKECLTDIGVLVDPDQLTAQHNGNEYEGGRAAIARLQDCLAQHIDFTEESTLSGSFSRKMARTARDAGYTVRLYYVGLDTAEESVRRIANRVARGGHDIPAQDVYRRFARRFRDLAKLLPLCNEATFYDNDNGFRAVAFYRNGELLSATDAPPAWLLELQREIAPRTHTPVLSKEGIERRNAGG